MNDVDQIHPQQGLKISIRQSYASALGGRQQGHSQGSISTLISRAARRAVISNGDRKPRFCSPFFRSTLQLLWCKVCTTKLSHSRGSLHDGQIGRVEQDFRWEVLYNHYVLHVGA